MPQQQQRGSAAKKSAPKKAAPRSASSVEPKPKKGAEAPPAPAEAPQAADPVSEPGQVPQALPAPLSALLPIIGALLRPEKPTDVQATMEALRAPFPKDALEWRIVGKPQQGRGGLRGLFVPYISNRAVQDRLDEVFGLNGWQNRFKPGPQGGVLCGIAVRIVQPNGLPEWLVKWDAAENTHVEPVKGGISDAQKRAAVELGIGRYLYRVPSQWLRVDEKGRMQEQPDLPPAFLPKPKGTRAEVGVSEERRKREAALHITGQEWAGSEEEWDAQRAHVIAVFGAAQRPALPLEENSTSELPLAAVIALTNALKKKIAEGDWPRSPKTASGKKVKAERIAAAEEKRKKQNAQPRRTAAPAAAEEDLSFSEDDEPAFDEEEEPLTAEEREAQEEGAYGDGYGLPDDDLPPFLR